MNPRRTWKGCVLMILLQFLLYKTLKPSKTSVYLIKLTVCLQTVNSIHPNVLLFCLCNLFSYKHPFLHLRPTTHLYFQFMLHNKTCMSLSPVLMIWASTFHKRLLLSFTCWGNFKRFICLLWFLQTFTAAHMRVYCLTV